MPMILHSVAIVNRFVDSLRSNIKAVVFIHRYMDLDTAVSLALLQEELSAPSGMTKSYSSVDQSVSKQYSSSISAIRSTSGGVSETVTRAPLSEV